LDATDVVVVVNYSTHILRTTVDCSRRECRYYCVLVKKFNMINIIYYYLLALLVFYNIIIIIIIFNYEVGTPAGREQRGKKQRQGVLSECGVKGPTQPRLTDRVRGRQARLRQKELDAEKKAKEKIRNTKR
jgi:hypothetical protein